MNYSLLMKPRIVLKIIRNIVHHHSTILRAVKAGEKRFKNDPSFCIDAVPSFFASRINTPQDDTAIIKRIIAAYKAAKRDQPGTGEAYNVSNEWLPLYKRNLGAIMEVLISENVVEIQRMYQNFFRDQCSTGLVGLPVDMDKQYFGKRIKTLYKKYFLCDALHRFDLWKKRTNNAYSIHALESAMIGNPYGYIVDNVFIRVGSDYQHYYACAINKLLESNNKTVVELGGGFGGLAYFLNRDIPNLSYIDFDLPEALALASYYLMKAFPDARFTLYGEEDLKNADLKQPGIIMMPSFEIEKMPTKSVSASFNSYSLAEMSSIAIDLYVEHLTRITSGHILHVNHNRNAVRSADNFGIEAHGFELVHRELAGWTLAINPESDEYEYLYKFSHKNF